MEYSTVNTKILHKLTPNSKKRLGLGLGGKDILYKTMPTNEEEMMEPENYNFVSTKVIIGLVKAQWMSVFR